MALSIGILGGMGAAASADFYTRLVSLAQHRYGAEQDYDFPAMFLYNLPLVGFDETGFVDVEQVKKQLVAGVQKLEQAGSDFIVIPCNTVHYLYADMQQAVSVPILSIVEVVAQAVEKAGLRTVGLLGSESTKKYHLYESVFTKKEVATITTTDAEQVEINKIILKIISNSQTAKETQVLLSIISRYATEGVEGVVVGCTELPIAITQKDTVLPLFDSTQLLAEETLRFAYGK
jgi:aspartate racemase